MIDSSVIAPPDDAIFTTRYVKVEQTGAPDAGKFRELTMASSHDCETRLCMANARGTLTGNKDRNGRLRVSRQAPAQGPRDAGNLERNGDYTVLAIIRIAQMEGEITMQLKGGKGPGTGT